MLEVAEMRSLRAIFYCFCLANLSMDRQIIFLRD